MALAGAALFALHGVTHAQNGVDMPVVIEIVTFKLGPGTGAAAFQPLDRAVEVQHVSKQPGFISRVPAVRPPQAHTSFGKDCSEPLSMRCAVPGIVARSCKLKLPPWAPHPSLGSPSENVRVRGPDVLCT